MRRRRLLALLGVGGTAGCLRLAGDDETTGAASTTEPSGPSRDTASAGSTGEPTTESTRRPETPTLGESEALDVRWAALGGAGGIGVDDADVYVVHDGVQALGRSRGDRRWEPFPADGVRHLTLDRTDLFIGTNDGRVVVLDTDERSRRWTYEGTDLDTRVRVGEDVVVFGEQRDDGGALVCLERASGAERWRVETDGVVSDLAPPASGVVVFSATGRANVRARDLESGDRRWFSDESHTAMAPLVADGMAYVPTPFEVLAYDVASGDIAWRYELPDAGERFSGDVAASPPVLSDDVLCLPVERGGLAGVDVAAERGAWFYGVAESKRSTVAVADGEAWFADRGGVHRVDIASGEGRTIGRHGGEVGNVESLVVDDEALFLSTTFGGVGAFDVVG